MKTRLLKKLRKKAFKKYKIKIGSFRYGSYRIYDTVTHLDYGYPLSFEQAIKLLVSKRRDYILNEVSKIREAINIKEINKINKELIKY